MKDALDSVSDLKDFKHVNVNLMTVKPNFYEGNHMFKGEEQEHCREAANSMFLLLTKIPL